MSRLWWHVYGERPGVLALFSGTRPEAGSKRLLKPTTVYFTWPVEQDLAQTWAGEQSAAGREVYHTAHLLTSSASRRVKENAAPLVALYVDGDGAAVPKEMPDPTATVLSSPGREQFYWRLARPVPPDVGEDLNRRLAYAMGADKSGWDLTQLLRVPDTRNRKYPGSPVVEVAGISGQAYDPAELDRLLPSVARDEPRKAHRSKRPAHDGAAPELDRLSPRMRDLVMFGNRGEYPSRSEADFAAALAMFGAGYEEAEVWAAMTDPANGISEKFVEKGRHGERYLSLTIGKAKTRAEIAPSPTMRHGKVYARRKGAVRVG